MTTVQELREHDEKWMRYAISLAHTAVKKKQRPFGCVILNPAGVAIGFGYGSETPTDPTAHSEMDAIREACERQKGLLHGCTLYSTHEPCPMCCGAINHAKLRRVVFGSHRDDLPLLFRTQHATASQRLRDTSYPPAVKGGVLNELCVALFDVEIRKAGRQRA